MRYSKRFCNVQLSLNLKISKPGSVKGCRHQFPTKCILRKQPTLLDVLEVFVAPVLCAQIKFAQSWYEWSQSRSAMLPEEILYGWKRGRADSLLWFIDAIQDDEASISEAASCCLETVKCYTGLLRRIDTDYSKLRNIPRYEKVLPQLQWGVLVQKDCFRVWWSPCNMCRWDFLKVEGPLFHVSFERFKLSWVPERPSHENFLTLFQIHIESQNTCELAVWCS